MNESPHNTPSTQGTRGEDNANKAKWTDDQTRIFIKVLVGEAGKCNLLFHAFICTMKLVDFSKIYC